MKKKTLIYLGVSITLGFVFAIVYVTIMTITLPKHDLASGQGPFQDPRVFLITGLVAVVSGLAGWPLFAFLGRHSRPAMVAAMTGVTTLLFILVVAPSRSDFGVIGTYFVCLGALVYCYLRDRPAGGQQSALTSGVPATRFGKSGATEGPPSVSHPPRVTKFEGQSSSSIPQPNMAQKPPQNWSDKDAWDSYFNANLLEGRIPSYPEVIILRFLSLAQKKGGRIWFPGCGLDPYPKAYAERGCQVFATDFSSVATNYQERLAAVFLRENESAKGQGAFAVAEHDFTQDAPPREFDLVINSRAFQGLSPSAMRAAAEHFHAALRPGGSCILDTTNVQGNIRNLIEDSLIAAGFYIPFQKSERWYRQQLDGTGIVYAMVLGRPHIPRQNQYPREQFSRLAERDQQILDSFRVEYERRCRDEAPEENAIVNNPATIVATVVYATG